MDKEKKEYKVIVTRIAEDRFYQILDYLYENYSEERAEQIADELRLFPFKLSKTPNRGTFEKTLLQKSQKFKYILYKRANYAEIKVIYFIDEENRKVYITDFFPTEMNPIKLKDRN